MNMSWDDVIGVSCDATPRRYVSDNISKLCAPADVAHQQAHGFKK